MKFSVPSDLSGFPTREKKTVTVSTECSAIVVQDIELDKKPKGTITGSITDA